jgi:plastocyanin
VNTGDDVMTRRGVLFRMGMLTLGLGHAAAARQEAPQVLEIRIARNEALGIWYFDPLGVLVQRGQTVRWRNVHWGTTVTAYHPDYDNREPRIPEGAGPFDSGMLGDEQRTTFEWRFDVEGTYDYCSRYQEVLGMVGRVVVGRPGGPGENPLGYGAGQGRAPAFRRVSEVLLHVPSDRIVRERTVPFPVSVFGRKY